MRVLITGITGFAGGHLAEQLLESDVELVGCSRTGKWTPDLQEPLDDQIPLTACDLASSEQLLAYIQQLRPERIYHLAALADPRRCRDQPEETLRVNVEGTRNLYETLVRMNVPARVLHVSTSYVYGKPHPTDLPLAESAPLNGQGPYAQSKIQAERLAEEYAQRGLDIVIVRPFNHAGPRQQRHLVAEWAKQIAKIEAGKQSPRLIHGDLTARRDWTDVRDVVGGYQVLMQHGEPGKVYNLGSGVSRAAHEVLEHLRAIARVEFETVLDESLLRKNDPPEIVADVTRLREATGWQPQIELATTVRDTLDYWRRKEAVEP